MLQLRLGWLLSSVFVSFDAVVVPEGSKGETRKIMHPKRRRSFQSPTHTPRKCMAMWKREKFLPKRPLSLHPIPYTTKISGICCLPVLVPDETVAAQAHLRRCQRHDENKSEETYILPLGMETTIYLCFHSWTTIKCVHRPLAADHHDGKIYKRSIICKTCKYIELHFS